MNVFAIAVCSVVSFLMLEKADGQSIQSISQGVSLHLHGQYANWNSNSHFLSDISEADASGLGYGVELRYGITSMISGYLSYGNVNFNSNDEWEHYKTSLYRFGGQYSFGGTTAKLRPYIHAGGVYQNFKLARIFINDMGTQVIDDAELVSKGLAAEVGVGIKYHLIPEFVLELSLAGQFGKYGSNFINGRDFDFEETIDTQHFYLRLGAGYFFY